MELMWSRLTEQAGMGTSALVSAVTALPWDQDNESTTDDDGDVDTDSEDGHTPLPADMTQSAYTQPQRPKCEYAVDSPTNPQYPACTRPCTPFV